MSASNKKLDNPPYLQVAIDVIELEKAFKIASEVSGDPKIILEAGTPLIKSHGLTPVKIWSIIYRNNHVLADMKTMDTGYLEAELAYKNGADIVTVLGAADNETIKGAVKAARDYNKLVQVDLINIKDLTRRALELHDLGVDIIGLHAGIDQQKRGLSAEKMKNMVDEIRRSIGNNIYISIAGGIKEENVGELLKAGADIIVIGSYITRSHDPKSVVKRILKKHFY